MTHTTTLPASDKPIEPIDTKREEYRKYLERTGVLEAMSRSLTKLYEEPDKPGDAIGYIYKLIGESFPEKIESTKNLEAEFENERAKVKQLTAELEDAKAKLAAFQRAEADAAKAEDAIFAEDVPEPMVVAPPSPTVTHASLSTAAAPVDTPAVAAVPESHVSSTVAVPTAAVPPTPVPTAPTVHQEATANTVSAMPVVPEPEQPAVPVVVGPVVVTTDIAPAPAPINPL